MRLLVVNYDYPRPGHPGAHRWAAMSRQLREIGHDVTVVTAGGPARRDGVLQTPDLNSVTYLRRLLRRPVVPAAPGPAPGAAPAPTARHSRLLTSVVVPDGYLLSWNPWAVRAIARELGRRPVDCLITSSPPDSSHLLGFGPSRRGTPWIADFRDGWTFEPLHDPFPTAPQRALSRVLEARVARGCDGLVAVTKPIVDDFRNRFGVDAELITNGWDAAVEHAAADHEILDKRRFSFLHTGTVSGAWGRDPRVLLSAVRLLLEREPSLADRFEVVFVGSATQADLELLRSSGLESLVRYAGLLPRERVLGLQKSADALLLMTSDRVGEATGKLYEYIRSGRPILALASGNEAARIVNETGTGVCVSPHDPQSISIEMERAVKGQLAAEYAPRGLERYSYRRLAERMADLADRAKSRRLERHRVQ